MMLSKEGRAKILFKKLCIGDVFYLNDLNDYAMKIVPENTINVTAVLLTSGVLVYVPSDVEVESVEGEFVERK